MNLPFYSICSYVVSVLEGSTPSTTITLTEVYLSESLPWTKRLTRYVEEDTQHEKHYSDSFRCWS
nr:MAG TPA: hypothetical protein [Caudoviricetes sp.]